MARNITGFPQFARHLAAIHRMPPMHAPVRKFHVSDIVYSMLRRGISKNMMRHVGKMMLRSGDSSPAPDSIAAMRVGGARSGSMWGSVLKKAY